MLLLAIPAMAILGLAMVVLAMEVLAMPGMALTVLATLLLSTLLPLLKLLVNPASQGPPPKQSLATLLLPSLLSEEPMLLPVDMSPTLLVSSMLPKDSLVTVGSDGTGTKTILLSEELILLPIALLPTLLKLIFSVNFRTFDTINKT